MNRFENLSENSKKMLIVIFYIAKMQEIGLVEKNGKFDITEKGFDMALNIVESGFKLRKGDIFLCLRAKHLGIQECDVEMFSDIIFDIQEKGYQSVAKEFENFKIKSELK